MSDPAPPPGPGLRSLLIDIGLPWLALQVLERAGWPTLSALGVAAIFPAFGLLLSWRKGRGIDAIAAIVLASLGIGLLVALLVGDARFALLKGAPAFALFGLACLASLRARRPLMFFVARYFAPGDASAKADDWEARLARPGFRDAMRRLTLVWGSATLFEAALGIAAAFTLPLHVAVIAEPALGLGTIALLLAWTRRFRRSAADRPAPYPDDLPQAGSA
jgi:branched-subunit amino acid transport protein